MHETMIWVSVLNQSHVLVPDDITEINSRLKDQLSILKKCRNIEEFKQAHALILKLGLFSNAFYASNLITTCALTEWGSMDYACSIFEQIEEPGSYDFNNMIRGYVKDSNFDDALYLYVEMLKREIEPDNFTYPFVLKATAFLAAIKEGKQIHGRIIKFGFDEDLFVQNSLINMYGKCREKEFSCAVFGQIREKNVVSWSALIAAYAHMELWNECLGLFKEMAKGQCSRSESSILVSVLSACTQLGDLDLGRCIHSFMLRNLDETNVIVETSLIDMYVKCGSLQKGLRIFQNMTVKNMFSYSAMISGLAMYGNGREALRVFGEMVEEKWPPDDAIYVGVLSACSHDGLVDMGLDYFNKMNSEHNIKPTIQHYGCLIDLMGRNGKINEAFDVIKNMPMEPNDVCWRSLLSSCALHHNLEVGEIAAEMLFQSSNPYNAGDYLMLSNMYAKAQKWKKVAKTLTNLPSQDLTQTPGFSMAMVKRHGYKFVSQDMVYPQCTGVYEMIYQIEWQLRFEGYTPDISQVLIDIDDEEKRRRLSGHSQKLAIAFALIHTSEKSPVRIIRNLRMCSDCHAYTKLVSMVFVREIIVKERNLFHVFKDGACSCKDYW